MVWYVHQNIFEDNKGYVCFVVDESVTLGIDVIGYKRADNRGIYLFKRGNDDSDLYLFRVETASTYSYKAVVTDTTAPKTYSMSGVTYDSSAISSLTISAYSLGGLVVITGLVTPTSTTWISASSGGALGNLPFSLETSGSTKAFPCSTYTNTSRGMYIASNASTDLYFNGTPEGGAEYAFCAILRLAQ